MTLDTIRELVYQRSESFQTTKVKTTAIWLFSCDNLDWTEAINYIYHSPDRTKNRKLLQLRLSNLQCEQKVDMGLPVSFLCSARKILHLHGTN